MTVAQLDRLEPRKEGDRVEDARVAGDGEVSQFDVVRQVGQQLRPHRHLGGGEARADRGIGGKLDDAVMFLAQLQLADRAHHAVAARLEVEHATQAVVVPPQPGARRAWQAHQGLQELDGQRRVLSGPLSRQAHHARRDDHRSAGAGSRSSFSAGHSPSGWWRCCSPHSARGPASWRRPGSSGWGLGSGRFLGHLNKHGVPTYAMWADLAFNALLLLLSSAESAYTGPGKGWAGSTTGLEAPVARSPLSS